MLVKPLNEIIKTLIALRQSGRAKITLLAVCPNSAAVLEAAVRVASVNNVPMLFAATLNQVDVDGGYTGWTPAEFVCQLHRMADKYHWEGPLYLCLDHGGPWLKDRHTLDQLSLDETMARVKDSLTACIKAGYQLLHIDPTVDRTLPAGELVPIDIVVERMVELIAHAEQVRRACGLPIISYEVGTEEVHGGLVDIQRFEEFIRKLKYALDTNDIKDAWPCFVVAQVGTNLHTTYFDSSAAMRLHAILSPLDSLVKGHYSDWVENPQAYPETGMGGANVGPEFTSEEYLALMDLALKENSLNRSRPDLTPSRFVEVLKQTIIESGRWKKWLQSDEEELQFEALPLERQSWLLQTGARYIWTEPAVIVARRNLYQNLSLIMPDPNDYVVTRIAHRMDRYINQFNLFDSLELLR
jgi:tagatose-1,6-bisphosphate aldolase non-catalytic subunit AgaZ/GatZ